MKDEDERRLRVDPAVREEQSAALAKLRSERSGEDVRAALAALDAAAKDGSNLMPPIIQAVRVYATLGEICDTLRNVFGEYTAPTTV